MILFLVSIKRHQEEYMDALLTPAEVAERLRRPVATVRYWRAMGIGPKSANVGGRVLYRRSDVEAWVEEKFNAPQGAA
jgi:predicted DNA-binding transcriptional regulator AlpA